MKHKFCNNYGEMFENIMDFTCDYLDKSNIKTLVIGMSGGIDSTLCAALASEVCQRKSVNVTVEGRVLPIESHQAETSRAIMASQAFCDHYKVDQMTPIYNILSRDIIPYGSSSDLVRRGNVKARLRMMKLYDLAREMNGVVLSTDNYTEYLLGFWTLHGDVGDYGMIQNLWKTEVYGLAYYLIEEYKDSDELYKAASLQECVKAMPTDGLGITISDFDQIYPNYDKNSTPVNVYGKIDTVLLNHLNNVPTHVCCLVHNGVMAGDELGIIDRHKATEFKRVNPFSIPRKDIVG